MYLYICTPTEIPQKAPSSDFRLQCICICVAMHMCNEQNLSTTISVCGYESCHTRITHMDESHIWTNRTYKTNQARQGSVHRVTWTMCDSTPSHVSRASFIRVTCLIHMCDMSHSHVWHDSFTRVSWLIHTCDVTQSHARHDSFIRVTWLISMCAMTHSRVWRASSMRETGLICVTWRNHMSGMHVCDMTHATDKIEGWVPLDSRGADSRGTPTARGRQCRMSKERTRGEWDWGVENKNTHDTQTNLTKQKLGAP